MALPTNQEAIIPLEFAIKYKAESIAITYTQPSSPSQVFKHLIPVKEYLRPEYSPEDIARKLIEQHPRYIGQHLVRMSQIVRLVARLMENLTPSAILAHGLPVAPPQQQTQPTAQPHANENLSRQPVPIYDNPTGNTSSEASAVLSIQSDIILAPVLVGSEEAVATPNTRRDDTRKPMHYCTVRSIYLKNQHTTAQGPPFPFPPEEDKAAVSRPMNDEGFEPFNFDTVPACEFLDLKAIIDSSANTPDKLGPINSVSLKEEHTQHSNLNKKDYSDVDLVVDRSIDDPE